MDAGQVAQIVEVLGPPVINFFESLFAAHQKAGADKKAAAIAAIAAHPDAQTADPELIADAVQAKFDQMKADGTLGAPAAPAPVIDEAAIEAEVQKRVAAAVEAANSKEGKAPHGVVFGVGGGSTVQHG